MSAARAATRLVWREGHAEARGWRYMVQTERPLHEGVWRSLLISPPNYDEVACPVGPKVPWVRHLPEGTVRYVKAAAQAHADLVAADGVARRSAATAILRGRWRSQPIGSPAPSDWPSCACPALEPGDAGTCEAHGVRRRPDGDYEVVRIVGLPWSESPRRYFVTVGDGPEREVRQEEYVRVEREAGFTSKFGPCTPATGSFSASGDGRRVAGRVAP